MRESAKIKLEEKKTKISRTRSPNFPYVSLEKSVDLIRTLYSTSKRHFIPISIAHEKFGYKAHGSVPKQITSALKSFGLIETDGVGEEQKIKISDNAYDAFMLNGPNRDNIIKEMALAPLIHRQLWEQHEKEGIPNDEVLKYNLITDFGFNEDSVGRFIEQFKATLSFAKLDPNITDRLQYTDKNEEKHEFIEENEGNKSVSTVLSLNTLKEIPIFLDENKFVKIPYPLTESDYTLLLDQLKILKSRLVKEEKS